MQHQITLSDNTLLFGEWQSGDWEHPLPNLDLSTPTGPEFPWADMVGAAQASCQHSLGSLQPGHPTEKLQIFFHQLTPSQSKATFPTLQPI